MFASIIVYFAVGLVLLAVCYTSLVAYLNRRVRYDLEKSYQDRCFAKRCLEPFSVCGQVLDTITETIKETLQGKKKHSQK